jgi:hypothetical protein
MDLGSEVLEHTLRELERRGGSAFASSSKRVGLQLSLSESRPNGSVVSAVVSYSGATLTDGTPLQIHPDGTPLLGVDGKPTPEPPGYDALQEAGIRDELIRRDWKTDGARLRKDWLLGSAADRVSLREDIEGVLAVIGPNDNLELTYRPAGADAGFAQAGCAVILASSVIGVLISVVVVFIVAGSINPVAGVIGFIVGWLSGMFVSSQIVGLAVRVRRSRPNAEDVAILAGICASGTLAAIVTLLLGLISEPG